LQEAGALFPVPEELESPAANGLSLFCDPAAAGSWTRRLFRNDFRLRLLANPKAFTHNSLAKGVGGFMSATRSETFQLGLLLATVFVLLMQPTTGRAYTQEEEAACSGDAFRLCSPEIPDVDRVTACMVRNKAQLSPGCLVYFRPGPEDAAAAPAGQPLSIAPVTARKPAGAKTSAKSNAKTSAKARKPKKPTKPDAT
jgi:hypothetical protein